MNGSERQILFKDSGARIENVLWSPDGNYIAFTRWVVDVGSFPSDAFGVGELRLMKADGTEQQLLSATVIHFDNQLFRPVWSPDSQKIVFVMNKSSEVGKPLSELSSNLYLFDGLKGQISQLTNFENTQLIKPIWSRDGSQIAFLMNDNPSANQFKSQTMVVNDRSLKELGVDEALLEIKSSKPEAQSVGLDPQSFIVWLPEPF